MAADTMNILNENSYSGLIYRFMDGDTNSVQQKVLFDALAKDSELQNEFQQAVTIVKGFQADKMALMPSAKLTNKIFQNAGFASLMQAPANNESQILKNFGTRLSAFTIPVISTVAGALITTMFFFAGLNPFNSNNSDYITAVLNGNNNNKALTSINSNDNAANTTNPDISLIQKSANILQTVNHNNFLNDLQPDNQLELAESNIQSSNNTGLLADNEINEPNLNSINDEMPITQTNVNTLNMSVELRGISGLAYLPGRAIQPEKYNLANNLAVSIMHRFNDNNSAGLVFGQESLQMYSFVKSGDNMNFDLEPKLQWVGVNYRYTSNELYGSIHPFAEIIAAGTKFGPMGKVITGLTYNPENFLTMSVGLEGSALVYRFLGENKSTGKLSLVYNIGVNF